MVTGPQGSLRPVRSRPRICWPEYRGNPDEAGQYTHIQVRLAIAPRTCCNRSRTHHCSWRHTILHSDPYNSIHEANLIASARRAKSHIQENPSEKPSKARTNSLSVSAARAAYDRAISAAFAR